MSRTRNADGATNAGSRTSSLRLRLRHWPIVSSPHISDLGATEGRPRGPGQVLDLPHPVFAFCRDARLASRFRSESRRHFRPDAALALCARYVLRKIVRTLPQSLRTFDADFDELGPPPRYRFWRNFPFEDCRQLLLVPRSPRREFTLSILRQCSLLASKYCSRVCHCLKSHPTARSARSGRQSGDPTLRRSQRSVRRLPT